MNCEGVSVCVGGSITAHADVRLHAIGSLEGTWAKMSTDVDVLLTQLDGSMAQADALINSLNASGT